tara:strand:- start:2771 stop:3346 length:576 start_codon:yes stop_codon:yes gene_type:complete
MIFGLTNDTASADWSSDQSMMAALSGNYSWVQLSMLISAIGQIIIIIGIFGIRDSMSGGEGHKYAVMSSLFLAIGATMNLIWGTLLGVTGEAAAAGMAGSAPHMAIASATFAAAIGIGATGGISTFIGMSLLGIGISIQKNFNIILGILLTIIGIVGIVLTLLDSRNTLLFIPWIGTFVILLAMAGLSLRK